MTASAPPLSPANLLFPIVEVWLTRKEAAHYLTRRGCQLSEQTLRHWACDNNRRGGPPFYRNGWKSIRYLKTDLDLWREKRMERVA